MATILYAWELGGGLGHILRSLPFTQRLIARGHRVVAALRELKHAEYAFADADVEYLPAPHHSWRIPDRIDPVRGYGELLHNVGFCSSGDLRILTRAWQTVFAMTKPDLVLCDHSPTALLAASLDDIPYGNLGTGFCCPPAGKTLPDLRPWLAEIRTGQIAAEERVLGRVNELRAVHRKPPWECLPQLYSSVAETFLTTFAELDHFRLERQKGLPATEERSFVSDAAPSTGPLLVAGEENSGARPSPIGLRYWGVWESDRGEAITWPSGSGPRVFLYTHRFPARDWLLEHLRDRGFPTIAYTYDLAQETAEKLAGPTISLAAAPLNVAHAAAESDIAILNSGHNSAAQFLLAGKPLLLLPISLEQGLLMRRLVEQGLAVSAACERPGEIRAALDDLLTKSCFRDAARAFAAKYASYDSEAAQGAIVDRIEQLMQPSSRTP